MGDQGITSINRFQHWVLRSRWRAAAVLATPTVVVLFLASIAAGLSIATAAAVAAGIGLAVALIAALVVWASNGGDPELQDLDVRDRAVVQHATSSTSGAVAIRSDPRLRSVAIRAAASGSGSSSGCGPGPSGCTWCSPCSTSIRPRRAAGGGSSRCLFRSAASWCW